MIIEAEFEDKVLACLLKMRDFGVAAAPSMKAAYFSGTVKHNIAEIALRFLKQYQAVVTIKAFAFMVADLVKRKVIKAEDTPIYGSEYERLRKLDVSDWAFVRDKLIDFIKGQEWKALIEDSVKKHLPRDEFALIEKRAAEIARISATPDSSAYDYFDRDAILERTVRREIEFKERETGGSTGISTGIRYMDSVMPKGGWYKKNLYIIMAPPKVGKTMALLWFANVGSWQGANVAYFSFETSIEVLSDRLDGMNSDTDLRELVDKRVGIAKRMIGRGAKGKLFLFEYPTKTCTVAEVERKIRQVEADKGVQIDMVVCDYGDIMRPAQRYQDRLQEQATIFEDLRALAVTRNIPVVTATQVNRSGSPKAVTSGVDVAGTYEKIMVADCVITLSQAKTEKTSGKMRVFFAESRNNASKSFLISTKYTFGKFFGEFIEEED